MRDDSPATAAALGKVARAINELCVSVPPRPPFPPGNICCRGGGFDEQFKPFFVTGRSFRQLTYLASSREVAMRFLHRSGMPHKVLWLVHIHPERKCVHVNLVEKTNIHGEEASPDLNVIQMMRRICSHRTYSGHNMPGPAIYPFLWSLTAYLS